MTWVRGCSIINCCIPKLRLKNTVQGYLIFAYFYRQRESQTEQIIR